jgi:hypothetical protein
MLNRTSLLRLNAPLRRSGGLLCLSALCAWLTSSGCSKAKVGEAGAPPGATFHDTVATRYSPPVVQGLARMSSSLNNTTTYALRQADLDVLQAQGLIDADDTAALQPFLRPNKQ